MDDKATLLKQAKEKYKHGTVFLSATGNLNKHPMKVTGKIRWGEFCDCIVSDSPGVLWYEGNWAKIIK